MKSVYFPFMDLEKGYDIVDRDTMWQLMRIYGLRGKVLRGIMSFMRRLESG